MEVYVRIKCEGWRCRKDKGSTTVFIGYLQARLLGNDNIITLEKSLPEGWTARNYPDSEQEMLFCAFCTEKGAI